MIYYNFDDIIQKNELLNSLFTNNEWWEDYYKYIDLQANLKSITTEIITNNYISKSALIENNVTIKGPVIILDNCEIYSGSYIVGPALIGYDCKIGPNSFINSNCIIGNHIKIGQCAEIKCSVIMDKSKLYSLSYIGHSIIGKKVKIGSGVITAISRFDDCSIKIRYKNIELDSKQNKFGAIIGNETQIGIGVKILPGKVIKPKENIYPNSIINRDIL
ncbi:hypothetical protein HY745_14335 [Candidatus Desantisbacteria bacterium]|nr:hypothetical protein [Candidatus Desantisbacteria bacterium]